MPDEPLLSPPDLSRVEAYRAGKQALMLTVVVTEIFGHAELREPARTSVPQPFAELSTEFIERRFGGLIARRTPFGFVAVFAEPMSACLAAAYLHAEVATTPLAGMPCRLRSSIDIGMAAPPRLHMSPPALFTIVAKAEKALPYARRNDTLVSEDVVRHVCGRLDGVINFVRPEKRALQVNGQEVRASLFHAETPMLPPRPPVIERMPRATVTLNVQDDEGEQTVTFDADRDGHVIIGSYHTCHVVVKAEGATSHHARVLLDDSGNWICDDLDGEGTFVNGQHVVYGVLLSEGNLIQVGTTMIVVEKLQGLPKGHGLR